MSADWTPEALDRLAAEVKSAAAENKTLADRANLLEKANADLLEQMAARDAADAAEAVKRAQETDQDRTIVRAYTVDASQAKGIATRGPSQARPVMAHKGSDVAIRMYGQHNELGDYAPGLLDDQPCNEWQAKAQELAEEVSMVRAFGLRPNKSIRRFAAHMQKGPDAVKRIFTDATDYGEELLPDMTAPVLQRAAELSRRVEALFPVRQIGPGGTKKNPFLNYGSGQFFVRNFAAPDDNDPATLKTSDLDFDTRSLDPVTMAAVLPVDLDAEEDAIIEWASVARDQLVRSRIDAVEDAIINGDSAATHQDPGLASWSAGGRWATLGSSKDHRKAWVGLRARAFDTGCTTDISAAAGASDYVKQLAQLSVAHTYGDTILMPSPLHFLASLATDADVFRADGAGDMASVIQGASYMLWGRPVVLSQFNSDDLNASGLYDGVTQDYGSRLAFDRSRFEIANRRGIRMTLETYVHKGVRYMTVTDRLIFRTFDAASTKNVHVGYKAPKS